MTCVGFRRCRRARRMYRVGIGRPYWGPIPLPARLMPWSSESLTVVGALPFGLTASLVTSPSVGGQGSCDGWHFGVGFGLGVGFGFKIGFGLGVGFGFGVGSSRHSPAPVACAFRSAAR